jgi:hypothetical protein
VYFMMIVGIYATLGVFLLNTARAACGGNRAVGAVGVGRSEAAGP